MRRSDTYERVFEAADQLLADGTRPTQQNVRERLGSGSATTIHKALNDWWRSLGERLTRQKQEPDLPPEVIRTADELWGLALRRARAELEQARAALKTEAGALQAERAQIEERARQESSRTHERLESAYSQVDALRSELQRANQELLESERKLIEERTRTQTLEREIKTLELVARKEPQAQPAAAMAQETPTIAAQQLQRCREQLGQQEAAAQQARQECHNLQLTLGQLDARYQNVRDQLEQTRAELARVERHRDALRQDLAETRGQWQNDLKKMSQHADLHDDLKRCQTLLESKEQEVARLMSLLKSS